MTNRPALKGASFVMTSTTSAQTVVSVLIAGSMRLCNTGVIFLGVDHLKHPSKHAAKRRSHRYLYVGIGADERRSVSRTGRWWFCGEGRERLRCTEW